MEKLSNKEFNEIWRKKTKEFALKVIALSDELPKKINSTSNSYVLTFLRSSGLQN
jgi:hypothetical protein